MIEQGRVMRDIMINFSVCSVTRRVTAFRDHPRMMKTQTPPRPSFEETSLENCEAVLICLNTRKFIVIRHDGPRNLWPIDGGWDKLRDLKPGDEVIYKGDRTTVVALDVYR